MSPISFDSKKKGGTMLVCGRRSAQSRNERKYKELLLESSNGILEGEFVCPNEQESDPCELLRVKHGRWGFSFRLLNRTTLHAFNFLGGSLSLVRITWRSAKSASFGW